MTQNVAAFYNKPYRQHLIDNNILPMSCFDEVANAVQDRGDLKNLQNESETKKNSGTKASAR